MIWLAGLNFQNNCSSHGALARDARSAGCLEVCWGSRKQKSIALSSCESEIVALSEAAKEVIYLRKFVRGLVPSLPEGPTVVSTDNKGARDLSYNPEHHDKSKHIARRQFFIRDMVTWSRLRRSWCHGLVQRTTMRTSLLNLFRRRGLRCCVEISKSHESALAIERIPQPSFAGGR